MSDAKLFSALLLLLCSLNFSAYAESNFNAPQQKNQAVTDGSLTPTLFIPNQVKPAKVKLGMVFTPEELTTLPYQEYLASNLMEEYIPDENSERIIGFYIKTFF